MSNRPVRLKYLKPKMKIILCIFLLYITAVSVFGQSVPLDGILGEIVEFPAAVKNGGFLKYSNDTIGDSSLRPPGYEGTEYRDRLHWDSSTGLFSLSGLKMEDSGEYEVHNTDQNIAVFQLNVYKGNVPVSKPHVSITHNEHPCTIECTAERGTGATLSWYREGEKKSLVSSRVASAPYLHLPQTVERSGTYTCEANNSVSRETSDPLTVGAHCTAPTSSSPWIIVASVVVAVVALIAVVCAALYCRIRRGIPDVEAFLQAKMLLDDVDLQENGETITPDAGRTLFQVKKILDNVHQHEYVIRKGIPAVGALIRAKTLLDDVDLQENGETIAPEAGRKFLEVKKILDNVHQHKYVKKILDNVHQHKYVIRKGIPGDAVQPVPQSGDAVQPVPQSDEEEQSSSRDSGRSFIPVKKILNNVVPQQHVMIQCRHYPQMVAIHHPGATEKMASLHEIEVPSNQDTEVVEP